MAMHKGRLEAFSDGVIAIIITVMVLEMKAPHSADFTALRPMLPVFLSYTLSFIYLGIYWNNHHHLLQAAKHVNGQILWANLHLLFWLSLIPFTTAWMGENNFSSGPVALYGIVLFFAAVAYFVLTYILKSHHGKDSLLATALTSEFKEWLSVFLYAAAIATAYLNPQISCTVYVVVAGMWLVPDRRIERLAENGKI